MRHAIYLFALLLLCIQNAFSMDLGEEPSTDLGKTAGIPKSPSQNLDESLAEFRKTYASYLASKKQTMMPYQPSEWDLKTISFMGVVESKINRLNEANMYLYSHTSCGIKCYLDVFMPTKCYRFVIRVTKNCDLNRVYIRSSHNPDIKDVLFAILRAGYSFKCLDLSRNNLREVFDLLKIQKQLAPKDRMLETWTKIYIPEGGAHMRIIMNEENGKYIRITRNPLFTGWRAVKFNPAIDCWETVTMDDKGRHLSVEKDENGDLILKHISLF